jgi:hypothetical protein
MAPVAAIVPGRPNRITTMKIMPSWLLDAAP